MNKNIYKVLLWILIGNVFGMIAALMCITGSRDFNNFYDGGNVYDVTMAHRTGDLAGMQYHADGKYLEITDGNACKNFFLSGKEDAWNYIIMNLSSMNAESIEAEIEYYDKAGTCVGTNHISLSEGENIIASHNISYENVSIWIRDQVGKTFSMDKVQFREKLIEWDISKILPPWMTVLICYCLITGIVLVIKKKIGFVGLNWYLLIDFLQGIYIAAGTWTGSAILYLNKKIRSRIRIILFVIMILYMQIITNISLYEATRYYKYQMAICSMILIAIGIFCYEGKLQKKNWNNVMVQAWTALWILACVSDFLIRNRYTFLGYIMFFVVGFFYFMWNNMEDRKQIIIEFIRAIIISFVITTVFCLVCRPLTEGYRYSGTYYSPGMYAMYVLFVWIAFWGDIEHRINQKKMSVLLIAEIAGAVVAGVLMWKTQSSSGVLPAAVVLAIFLFQGWFLQRKKNVKKRMIQVVLIATVLVGPIEGALHWGLTNIPQMLNTEVYFKNDAYYPASAQITFFQPMTIYASKTEEDAQSTSTGSRILKKLFTKQSLEEFTSARDLYWMGHIREINLFGHENRVELWGSRRWPHNGFIAILYRYGIFSVIPYTIMVFRNLILTWKYMLHHRKEYGFFMFAVMFASFILILMENLELPFLFLCWMAMYFMMGINFEQEEKGA